MPETRMFDGSSAEGIQKLVREALGETIRPVGPGLPSEPAEAGQMEDPTATIDAVDLDTVSWPFPQD